MMTRLFAFVTWGAVGASAVFWALRLGVEAPRAPSFTTPVGPATAMRGDWSRVLGAPPQAGATEDGDADGAVEPAAASRFRLLGVVAPKTPSDRGGVALIAVDDKPARAFRVGAVVDGQTVLLAVHRRGASLGPRDGTATVELELPALPPPATGALPPARAGAMPPPAPMPGMLPRPPAGAAPAPAAPAPGDEPPSND
jgi:general secretion pathway protein C